jgi:hypothetical protein
MTPDSGLGRKTWRHGFGIENIYDYFSDELFCHTTYWPFVFLTLNFNILILPMSQLRDTKEKAKQQ